MLVRLNAKAKCETEETTLSDSEVLVIAYFGPFDGTFCSRPCLRLGGMGMPIWTYSLPPPSSLHRRGSELISAPSQSSLHPSTHNVPQCHHHAVAMEGGAGTSCRTPATRMTQHQPSVGMDSLLLTQQQSLPLPIKALPNASATPTVPESADLLSSSSKITVTSTS
ncbi:hypothetical protein HJC23_008545 [Cyclotella cryptica]|uniref:Uncharacterized protein n=1 Tax=Cyclotella cryptica TaxID=29204 RepID=A0ABD3QWL8_9STRA